MDKLGRYQILGELGRGACGVVYRAQDPKIGRQVAIKTIPTHELREFADGRDLYERLCREAQSAGVLSHPNIVTVYELDEDGKMTYIVMELVEGKTLREIMASGVQPRQMTLDVLQQIASGLDFAHRKGIVHRDVKPGNVIVDPSGLVKITDFGVAKILAAAGTTQTGTTVGTPFYMSPEQVHGRAIDGRADQFALAVIAYEMLVGHRPFQGESLPTIIHQILSVDVPRPEDIERLGPAVPVLKKALAKNPDDRYTSCQDFARALRVAYEGELGERTATGGQPVVAQKRSPVLIGLLVAALALCAFLLYRTVSKPTDTVPQPTAATQPSQTYVPPVDPAAATKAPEVKPVETKPAAETKASESRASELKARDKKEPAKAEPKPVQVAQTAPPAGPAFHDVAALPAAGRYTGPPEGRFSWNGSLKPGDRLAIAGARAGTGGIAGKGLPAGVKVIAEIAPADLRIVEQPSERNGFRLVISNPSQAEVTAISINWREASQ
jgi:serine/threonine-protein kinase